MIIAILVFFVAIFVGILFLLALMRFFFRRKNNSPKNFTETPANYGGEYVPSQTSLFDSDHNTAAIYMADSVMDNQNHEHHATHQTAHDSLHQTDNSYSHESHGASAASATPVDTSYTESSFSSSDSGSSDSGGSSSSSD